MGILYLISTIILLVSFILIKKTEHKIDIFSFVCTSTVLLFCYNTFVCYILTFFTIPIKLWILAIINLFFAILLSIPSIIKKEVQKYIFHKIDILYVVLIIIALLVVLYINFGFPFDVNYMSADSSLHYLTSVKFAESDALLPGIEEEDIVYGSQNTRKPVSYVNSGLLMKCFLRKLDIIECYKIFVGFGIFTFILIGITIYSALKKFARNREHIFWAFLVALICSLGYPLNSFLFGFEYLTMGLLILCTIIDIIYYYDNNSFKLPYIVLIFALLNFGLFCSYYMFIPFVYSALWIYFCIKSYQKTKKIINKEAIVLCGATLLLPFLLGYIYHIEPKVYAIFIEYFSNISSKANHAYKLLSSGISADGFIYINLYSNMLLLLPLTIYLFIIDFKENKLRKEGLLALLIAFVIGFIGILLIANKLAKVSIYYLSKNYFTLWIMLAFTNYKALVLIYEKNKYISRLFIYAYIFMLIVCSIFSSTIIEDSNRNKEETPLTVMQIFVANKTILSKKRPEYNQEELEIIKYAKNNLNFNTRIEIITDHQAYYWAYALLRYTDKDELFNNEEHRNQVLLEKKWFNLEEKIKNDKDLDYIIYFNKSSIYKYLKNELFVNAETIYTNEAGGILKYNN